MRDTVFIHTNAKQILGALVSAHSLKRHSSKSDAFDVTIVKQEDLAFFKKFEGRPFLRAGSKRIWRNDDLQSFTPCRFMPPELMGYQGRAVIIDPDVFAVGDITELFQKDMQGKAILAKRRPGHNGRPQYIATSVMLLDCSKLRHWDVRQNFEELFEFKRDYDDWITLAGEPPNSIGNFESEWNDFDRLAPSTKLLHNTKRQTQPWKTGLRVDYTTRIPIPYVTKILGNNGIRLPFRYKPHPDRHQEQYFFALARECLENGTLTEDMLLDEMSANHLRHDALEMVRSALSVEVILCRSQKCAQSG